MNIVENKREFIQDFIRLNEEWISSYFEIEAIDRELAANPSKVIEDGGFIFSRPPAKVIEDQHRLRT